MSLSQIRTYFNTRIAAVDSTYFEWNLAFDPNNIPRNLKNRSYYIKIGQVSSGPLGDQFVQDQAAVTLQLYFNGQRDTQSLVDTAIDEAHDIRMECVSVANAMSGTNIKNVVCNSITSETLSGSDNSVIVTLEFSVRLVFGF